MSFGLSGDDSRNEMIGGDVAVAWVDRDTLKGSAEDYYLESKSQCTGRTGACPDNRFRENSNDVRPLNSAMVNGYSIVTYQRPLKPSDEFDRQIHTNRSQAVIWAIGPLNERNEVSFHTHYTKSDLFLDFGRPAKWNCPMPEAEQPSMRTQAPPATTTAAPSRSRNTERRRGGNRKEAPAVDNERSASRTRQTERRGNTKRGNNNVRAVPTPAPVAKRNAWDIPSIKCYEPEDGVFYAQMGPTGGKRGYSAITGHVGWGISWYINGLLIPEINVVRGKTYTFVVEGGFDPEIAAKYHPFYITDDSVGGYEYKTAEEKKNVRIFAGALVAKDGTVKPTGTGRLCHWTQQGDLEADDFESFGAYQRTLELKCDQGEPGVIQWTPDRNTPDTVYYQCFTHRYLGWKINVHDSCDEQTAASEPEASVVPAPDLEESPSIRIETRVKPNALIVEDKEDKNNTTVSEKRVISPVTQKPIFIQTSDVMPVTHEPFLIQTQEMLPTSIYMAHIPVFTTYNPFTYDNPFYTPYRQSFKPSPPLESVREIFRPDISPEAPKESTLPLSTTTAAATTTTTTTSTTAAAITSTETLTDTVIGASSNIKPTNQSFFVPPFMHQTNFIMRRPSVPKRWPYQPMVLRPPPYKKHIYRPPMKVFHKRPLMEPLHLSESHTKLRRPQTFIIAMAPPPPPKPLKIVTTPPTITAKNVEISPQQASTEKEPDMQMVSSSAVEVVKPFKPPFSLKPAQNTGFRPESVIIESGFKPIITKEIQKRIDEPDLEYESEIGVIDHERPPLPPQSFEPVFVPSPIDKLKHKRPYIKKVIIKHSRSIPEEDSDEPVAAAAERVESYYLPPLGTPPQISQSRQPSNIDIEGPEKIDLASPPDVVVTYDGKRVSGASLTAKIADRSSILDQRASKAAELIKARPQFAPFKGELPPLNPEIINQKVPQLQNRGLTRDLESPPRSSTRLSRVRQKRSKGDVVPSENS
ncbi:hypothetical protein Zmor_026624 [Zophobas morio]|uniref:DOMON domain-containing protein n=1 Tax=Zophobas morio TaxID=2755281 RepID=A0AA38M5N6_9CUCU|nr:hypothetical protein Zmor_026624 [Zophobas morio]